MNLEQRAGRGAHYAELLRSGEVTAALDVIEEQFAGEWANTHVADERENLWRSVQIVRKIRKIFGDIASDGKIASNQIVELKRLGK